MKFTQYFQAMRQRPDRAIIEIEWSQKVIEHPLKEIVQQDGRIRRWACIEEANGKLLESNTAFRWGNYSQRIF